MWGKQEKKLETQYWPPCKEHAGATAHSSPGEGTPPQSQPMSRDRHNGQRIQRLQPLNGQPCKVVFAINGTGTAGYTLGQTDNLSHHLTPQPEIHSREQLSDPSAGPQEVDRSMGGAPASAASTLPSATRKGHREERPHPDRTAPGSAAEKMKGKPQGGQKSETGCVPPA